MLQSIIQNTCSWIVGYSASLENAGEGFVTIAVKTDACKGQYGKDLPPPQVLLGFQFFLSILILCVAPARFLNRHKKSGRVKQAQ